jgi:hypothetical protein
MVKKTDDKTKFDGTSKSWPSFKEAMLKWADAEGFSWTLDGGQGLCNLFLESSAAAARPATRTSKGTISLDISTYDEAKIKEKLKEASVLASVALSVRTNRKDRLGANYADHDKLGMSADELSSAHDVLDSKYMSQVNRSLTRTLHDAVFPGDSRGEDTIAVNKLRNILKTPEVTKILAGEKLGDESEWVTKPWLIPALQMWAKLAYKFEGMTEMINGCFMDDLSELLNSATGDQRKRKTFYEIDLEFEKMCDSLLKNFSTIKSLMPFLRSSLRQTMIRKLSKVGKDKIAWKKAEEYLTHLQDDDHMLTLDDTDAAIKRAEQYLHRNDDAGEDTKDKVAFAAGVGNDQDAKLVALEAQVQALQAQLRGDTAGSKRGRNGVPVDKKVIPVCLKEQGGCGKRGHTVDNCWHNLDDQKAKIDAALEKRDKKMKEIAQRKPSTKETKAYVAACNKASAAAQAADDSEYFASVSLHGSRFQPPPTAYFALQAALDQEFVPNTPGAVLDSAGMLNILQGELGSGTRVKLTGITGDSSEAEIADAIFPVVTTDGKRYLIRIQGKNIIAKKATNCIMSLAVLMKAGYDVKFRVGSKDNAQDGGILFTPDGKQIALVFNDNMWRLPMWSKPVRQGELAVQSGFPTHVNTFKVLDCGDTVPTSVQEAEDIAYPGDVVDIIVQQTGVSFITAAATLAAYQNNVVDSILAIELGPAAVAAPEDNIIQAYASSATRPCDVSPLELSDADSVRLCHDRDGHPSNNKHRQIFKARKGKGFPPNFLALLDHFKCETCAVTAGARRYRQSKRVKQKGYHRQTAEKTGAQPTTSTSCTCCAEETCCADAHAKCFAHAVRDAPANQRNDTLDGPDAAAARPPRLVHAPRNRMHIDFANSITIGRSKERYYLILVIDGIDFTWAQPSTSRSEPEDLIHEFLTMTGLKISHIRADGAGEFARSANFQAYCKRHAITVEEVPAYTHTFNARAEGAIRICKEKVRALLRRANMPRRFWPDALLHWCRTYAHWPDAAGHTAWEKLDELGPHALCHDLDRDSHVFGSYVTGHLPREHPHVADTTHDDRAEEGVFLGNDLTTPTFWLWSFRHRKAMRLSDPKHFDHVLPFLQPADVHHAIPLTGQDILRMHAADDVNLNDSSAEAESPDAGEFNAGERDISDIPSDDAPRITRARARVVEEHPSADSGEKTQVQDGESAKCLTLKEHKALRHGRDVTPEAQLQYLKPGILAQALVHHKFVFTLPKDIRGDAMDLQVMASHAYSVKKFWYVDCEIIAPKALREPEPIQIPVIRGVSPTTNHKHNLRDLFDRLYDNPITLADIGIDTDRVERATAAMACVWDTGLVSLSFLSQAGVTKVMLRKQIEERVMRRRKAQRVEEAYHELKAKTKAESEVVKQIHKQVTPTFAPDDDSIWAEVDLLEADPAHRGIAMRNPRFKPFWLKAEADEWAGLWEKGVFKQWSRSDLLPNDRVFTSRYVYKIKRSAKTGEAYRFKARMIVRGFQMEKGVDYVDNFSPTPGLAVARLMMSIAIANDMELHKIDIEQAFLQADKLDEGVNGRYFINPPAGSPEAGNKDVVYEVLKPLYGSPSSPRALHKTMDAYFKSEGFDTIGFEESVWVRPAGGKYCEDIYVSAHVDDCLLSCKSANVMSKFKKDLLDRFAGTNEGEVTEYLGCELVRDRKARTGQLVQAGYAERVLRAFDMWESHPVATPLDPNTRLSKLDCPTVVNPHVHRKYRSIVGCISYLVNMTRPDLAFSFSQLSKFLQCPGDTHLAAAYRVLAYVRGTVNQGINFHDPGIGKRNILSGWVDSDFASDIDTRKSVTGYLLSLNGGPISWKAARQGGVTLSSSEAEFVAASQAGKEVLYLRALLKGFACPQARPTEIWEDNASCILMSENPTNRERSRHVDVRVHFLRDMVRDGAVKLVKCAGPKNVADALTKSLPKPAFHKHREFMQGTAQSFSAFFASAHVAPVATYISCITKRGAVFSKASSRCIGG